MSLMTCGLAGEGTYSTSIPFSTDIHLNVFEEDVIEQEFESSVKEVEFTAVIPVVEFGIDVIKIEECSWPAV